MLELLSTSEPQLLLALDEHHRELMGQLPSAGQVDAWVEEVTVVSDSLRAVCAADPKAVHWSVVFEFELPLENGRRPDVVILAGGSVIVLEFKQDQRATPAALDQVSAYVRDLSEYHEASHGVPAVAVLVPTKADFPAEISGVAVVDVASLPGVLRKHAADGSIDLEAWLTAPYAPLPTLIEAARRIFDDEPLPAVKRALASGIPEAVELLGQLAERSQADGRRLLAFIAGVPGSGKTLAGLTLVYQRTRSLGSATFLSGNGPLVEVLQDALKSRSFVRDLHGFIRTYGMSGRTPKEHVIVFDEAQRAWDRDQMQAKHHVDASEPDLLVQVGERLPGWASLIGLVGDGQEIHVGEEAGIGQWHEAIAPPNATATWEVHCPPRLAAAFASDDVHAHDSLDLTVTLRARLADDLHEWIRSLLAGALSAAAQLAPAIHDGAFPLWVTRDFVEAKLYARTRYRDEPSRRYGLLATSRAQTFLPKHGVDASFMTTKQVKLARWYNAEATDRRSSCALEEVVTEFGCQGLELDLPIVCWGDDLRWTGDGWLVKPSRSQRPLRDPVQLRLNAYRVLLSRGRDGLVVFLPDDRVLDKTEHALLAAGMRPLPAPVAMAAQTTVRS